MAVFPETTRIRPLEGYDRTPEESVTHGVPEKGNDFIWDRWGKLRFCAKMEFLLQRADAATLWAWYDAIRVAFFTFFDHEFSYMLAWRFGTGTGAQTTFTLPGKKLVTSGLLVYINGVATVAYTVSEGTGADGKTQLIFAVAPANGTVLTLTGEIRRSYECFVSQAERSAPQWGRTRITMQVKER